MLLMGALPSLAEASQGHISVVLLGATGDLAKKYLWQGLFQLYIDQVSSGHSFTFHGAALTDLEPGQKLPGLRRAGFCKGSKSCSRRNIPQIPSVQSRTMKQFKL